MSARDDIDPQGLYRADVVVNEIVRLECVLIEAALQFRQAEKAHWIESEVGTDPNRTFRERGKAYIKFVIACDNVSAARAKREETK